ncbi:ALG6, ALG8 glycosyltransferase [Hortaea werneckii]|nr:ALG6, ALG8 glycosyltransferase [Hortaea werneckii]
MAPSTPSHRPRKKRTGNASSSNGTTTLDATSKMEKPSFPLAAFFWPAKSHPSSWVLLPAILMTTFLFRWTVSMWPYSGYVKPPMHGDFEAQRHWMELTVNLPTTYWYFHDLEWWGLDYPPLTAYHSWILGQLGSWLDPHWFALYLSRGLDDAGLKVFMRASVVVSEYAVYVPAAVLCVRQLARLHNINTWESSIALGAIMMQPATILIDHGHFQYNTVMLGLILATMASMLAGKPMWSCVFFVATLGFKQMGLFYAPAVAAYLAGICISPRINVLRFLGIAVVTVASFAILFLPLIAGTAFDVYRGVALPTDAKSLPLMSILPWNITERSWCYPYLVQLMQAIHRIFPFARGLFEDKVANIWCAIHSSGVYKLNRYDSTFLSRAALGLTLASIAPPCFLLFVKPRKEALPYVLSATAWGFFLCSYQVHEKNVLLPLLPMTLLLAMQDGMNAANRAWIGYANVLGCWTMFPLLVRDGLRIPYFVLTGLWAWLMGLPPFGTSTLSTPAEEGGLSLISKVIHVATYLGMVGWHIVEATLPPPADKPDLWVVANVCLGCAGFGLCYLWCLWKTLAASGILYDVGIWKKSNAVGEKKNQ